MMAGGDRMAAMTDRRPVFGLRMLAMALIRLVVLGGAVFVMPVMSNDVMASLVGRPLAAAAAVVGMGAAGVAVYVGFGRLVERRRVEELSLPGMGQELGLGLVVGAGLYAGCVLILMVLGIYRIEGLNPWIFLLPAVAMALSAGIFEELLFRGVLFRTL
jgi:membrane protease YdiL (CAAX protease family)